MEWMEWKECATQDEVDQAVAQGSGVMVQRGHFVVSGSARVEASGSARVRASGSATVWARGSATVEASDSARVRASDSATVQAWGSSTVRAWDSSTVRAWDSATVQAWGSATVRALGRSVGMIYSASVHAQAHDWATVIRYADGNVTASATVVVVDRVIRTLDDWFVAYGVRSREDGKRVLYKWVDATGVSGRGMAYPVDSVITAPDWAPNPNQECGGGLHACASLRDALPFKPSTEGALAVELWVDPAECRAPQPKDSMPAKIRFREAYVARVWDPATVQEGEDA